MGMEQEKTMTIITTNKRLNLLYGYGTKYDYEHMPEKYEMSQSPIWVWNNNI